MDEKEIAVILEGHDHEIGSLKHRMHTVEQETKTINNIAMSIQRIAINVEIIWWNWIGKQTNDIGC